MADLSLTPPESQPNIPNMSAAGDGMLLEAGNISTAVQQYAQHQRLFTQEMVKIQNIDISTQLQALADRFDALSERMYNKVDELKERMDNKVDELKEQMARNHAEVNTR